MKLREARLCKKTFFRLQKIVFCALTSKNSYKHGFAKNNFSGSKKLFLPHCSDETQRSSALQKKIRLQKMVFCALTSKKSYKHKHGFAKKKSGSKKLFFSVLLSWNSDKPGFAKINFSGSKKSFFSHASCQICQLQLVTSFKLAPTCADACNT